MGGTRLRRNEADWAEPRTANHETRRAPKCRRPQSILLLERRQGKLACAHDATRGPPADHSQKDEVYLNLVLEFVPETVYRASRHYTKLKQPMPVLQIKLYMYQLLRSLAYIHSVGICHRDIKPQNLLLDPASGILKLCDFGSAKILVAGEPNVSYICSRYYRAPELIFGATNYMTNIGEFHEFVKRKRHLSDVFRHLVDRMCHGRIDVGTTALPRRVWH